MYICIQQQKLSLSLSLILAIHYKQMTLQMRLEPEIV